MRVLLLLRGAPGVGKTTWIEQNGLTPYALSADGLRLLCSAPRLSVSGSVEVDVKNDGFVWDILFDILERRMQNGEFTVIDATNSKTAEMNRYKALCDKYRYRMYCVDFTGVPMDVVKERNRQRPEVKRVPDYAIERMYARFATQKIPSGITVIQPDELDKVWLKCIDLSQYSKVHCIGDIHGCFTVLRDYFNGEGGIKDDEFYIFCGDYIDRGLENVEVVLFLMEICQRPNVLLLEGNHERWLWAWANDEVSKSRQFELITSTELTQAGIDKKDVRRLYRRFGQCAYFTYKGNTYLVTHAGLSTLPDNLTKVATYQMIHGVGNYNDFEVVGESFMKNTPDNVYSVHGHRNTKRVPLATEGRVYNLEGAVEKGGDLRVLQLLEDGSRFCVEVKNTVFAPPEEEKGEEEMAAINSVADAIMSLRGSKYVNEKRYGDISSFNFTKSAFYEKAWNEQTTKARGLYINVPKQKVVARAYDKFFNINEREETKLEALEFKLQFPVTAYVKENGFLGIVSYNDEDDTLFITTKSSPDGDYARWLRELFEKTVSEHNREKIKNFVKASNVSMVFECVDMEHDPHIIDYGTSRLFLLDIVHNEMTCRKFDYESLQNAAKNFGLQAKELAYVIDAWPSFLDWYNTVLDEDYLYNGRHIEGFVIEDQNGYMVKLKLAYYNFWKYMRGIAHETIRRCALDGRKTATLTNALSNHFYGWIRGYRAEHEPSEIPTDICTLRKMFFETDEGKPFAATGGL